MQGMSVPAIRRAHVNHSPTQKRRTSQETREAVLAAARRLFSEAGYEGATIRDIAAEAGMSTGAVFANFTDKSDLFREIMVADMEALVEAMRDGVSRGRGVDDTLLKLFVAGYAFYKTRLPLARAAFGISWMPEQGQELRNLPPVLELQELFTEQLTLGVERGELSQEAEVKLRSQMLFDCYLANFQEAIFGGWSLEALQAKSKDQIRVILAGARRG